MFNFLKAHLLSIVLDEVICEDKTKYFLRLEKTTRKRIEYKKSRNYSNIQILLRRKNSFFQKISILLNSVMMICVHLHMCVVLGTCPFNRVGRDIHRFSVYFPAANMSIRTVTVGVASKVLIIYLPFNILFDFAPEVLGYSYATINGHN